MYIFNGCTIYDWEIRFWHNKIDDPVYEIYNSGIDTTFHLINKKFNGGSIRVAGNFTCKHIPWYTENKYYSLSDLYDTNNNLNISTFLTKIVKPHIENNFLIIPKNDIKILIKNDHTDPNINFWKNIYGQWKVETFNVFDSFLSSDKVLIDIGGWIGTTCIYGSKKSKHVFTVEVDINSFKDLCRNCSINARNITTINKAIFINDMVLR